MEYSKGMTIESTTGKAALDTAGSVISSVKLDPVQDYGRIPGLLKDVINEDDTASLQEIKQISLGVFLLTLSSFTPDF